MASMPPRSRGSNASASSSRCSTGPGSPTGTVFDPTVVRGIAYYTSSVFEGYARKGDTRSLFGGGRYDHLIELFGGPPTPAAGIALGDQTLEILLKDAGRWPEGEPPLDTFVAVADPARHADAIALVQELRRAGLSADCDLLSRNLSRQLKEAARRRSRRALILGLREVGPDALVERDLATGAQREVARSAAVPTGVIASNVSPSQSRIPGGDSAPST